MAPAALSASYSQLPHLNIVDRFVEQFPVFNSALDYANARYYRLKSSSPLMTATLDRAEGAFGYVVTTAVVPVVKQLENPIHYVDNQAVRGFDLIQGKVVELQRSSGELKDSTLKVLDSTKERISVVKTQTITTVQSKVHSFLTLPGTVVPLVDQIVSAGEHALDYLLPESEEAKKAADGDSNGSKPALDKDPKDAKAVLRFIFVRVRQLTDKIQRRVVEYSRERWIPALFSKVIIVRENLSHLLANGAAAGNKLLLANGHAASSSQEPAAGGKSHKSSPKKAASTTPTKTTSALTSSSSSPASPNGDVNQQAATPTEEHH